VPGTDGSNTASDDAVSSGIAQPTAAEYGCWKTDKTNTIPIGRMMTYLDGVDKQGLPSTQFIQAQVVKSTDCIALFSLLGWA